MVDRPTQKALVANVNIDSLNPGFFPLGVTRLYTHSLNHTLVFIFHESRRTLKFEGNSIFVTETLAAPSQSDAPVELYPVKPRPVKILAPLSERQLGVTIDVDKVRNLSEGPDCIIFRSFKETTDLEISDSDHVKNPFFPGDL